MLVFLMINIELSKIKLFLKAHFKGCFFWQSWLFPLDKLGWAIFLISPLAALASVVLLDGAPLISFTLFAIFYSGIFFFAATLFMYPIFHIIGYYFWLIPLLYAAFVFVEQVLVYLKKGYWVSVSTIDGLEGVLGPQVRTKPDDWIGLHEIIFKVADSLHFSLFLLGVSFLWLYLLNEHKEQALKEKLKE